jgi:hypothetical protein
MVTIMEYWGLPYYQERGDSIQLTVSLELESIPNLYCCCTPTASFIHSTTACWLRSVVSLHVAKPSCLVLNIFHLHWKDSAHFYNALPATWHCIVPYYCGVVAMLFLMLWFNHLQMQHGRCMLHYVNKILSELQIKTPLSAVLHSWIGGRNQG